MSEISLQSTFEGLKNKSGMTSFTFESAIVSGLIYDHTGNYQIALMLYIRIYTFAILLFMLSGRPKEFASAQ